MSNNMRTIICVLLLLTLISLLFFILNVTNTFIVGYIFTVIAICLTAGMFIILGKKNKTKLPQGWSFVYVIMLYDMLNVIFSIVAYVININITLTITIHLALLIIFGIMEISLYSASSYINSVDKSNEQKHKKILEERKKYWN